MMMARTMVNPTVALLVALPEVVPDGADGIRRDTPGVKAPGFFMHISNEFVPFVHTRVG